MRFREFEQHFQNHQLILTQEIKNTFNDYDRRQLTEWVNKNWIVRIRQGEYILASKMAKVDKELLANEIKNSYISLEYALHVYNLIPEIPKKITSITTERSEVVKTPLGEFIYHRIQPKLFTGYNLKDSLVPGRKIRFASRTKALFDFIYLNNLSSASDFKEFRLNTEELTNNFDEGKYLAWLNRVSHLPNRDRLQNFLSFVRGNA